MIRLAFVVRSSAGIKCVKYITLDVGADCRASERACEVALGRFTASNLSLLIVLIGGKSHESNG